MGHLRKDQAPISRAAWGLIEDEARGALKTYLAARKLVDFDGPHGWAHSSVNLGRSRGISLGDAGKGKKSDEQPAAAALRQVLPLLELRVPFSLSRDELDCVERGADDIDLDAVVHAARKLARAEDRAIFYGVADASIQGIVEGSSHEAIALSADFNQFPASVSEAIARLRDAGVDGPYALALDADAYTALSKTAGPGGYPVLQHVRRLLDGPTIWAPSLQGALLLSQRGGDFQLVVGQDISIGYLEHDRDRVSLYLEESFTFRLLGPEAAVALPS